MVGYRFAWEPVQSTEVGNRVSILAFSSDEGLVSVGGQQLIRCTTMFPPGKLIALHNWILSGASLEQISLTGDAESLDVTLPDPSPSDFFLCSEVCAGLGGTSFGAQLSGLKPVAAMDKSPLAVEFLKRNRFPEVIHGDLASKHQVGLFHLAHDTRVGLLAGFPCQPFSSLGRHLAFLDDRAKTFFHILDLAFLIQCAFLLLECVVAAGRNKVVRESLASFCRIRGFKLVEQVLHLHRALPNHRTRWWCLIVPCWMPDVDIPDLPLTSTFDTVESVIPSWPTWPFEQEKQLQLTEVEFEAFHDPQYGPANRLLCLTGRCPTLLHSMGSPLSPCPCLCRGALSRDLLRPQGLHGVLVLSQWSAIELRHLHPFEACVLIGLPAGLDYGSDMRAALCLIGQVASPVQSHWMLRHLQQMLDFLTAAEVESCHTQMVAQHVRLHHGLQPSAAMYETRVLTVHLDDGSFPLTLNQPRRACELIDAECHLQGTDEELDVWDNGVVLSPLMLISGPEVTLVPRVGYGPFLDSGLTGCMLGLPGDGLTDVMIHHAGLSLLTCAGLPAASFLSPFTLDSLLLQWPQTAIQAIRDGTSSTWTLYGIMLVDSHWTCFRLDFRLGSLCVTWCDGLLVTPPVALFQLVDLWSVAWSLSTVYWTFMRCFSQLSLVDCGTVALMHLGALLGLWNEFPLDAQWNWHLDLVAFQRRVGFGPFNEAEAAITWLENFLPSKGVPTAKARSRAELAIQRLGLSAVQRAIQASEPWKALKSAGNLLGKPFQWVTYEELQSHIAARTSAEHGQVTKAKKTKGKPGRKAEPALALSPDTLTLFPTTFVDDHEEPVMPIGFRDIGSNARGICIVTVQQAMDLCRASNHLSVDALAIVSIGELSGPDDLTINNLQWPALYTPTSEPVLVKGSLVNLGDVPVYIAKVDTAPTVAMLETAVIRVMVYRDQFDKDWASFCKGPVKMLQVLVPSLRRCSDADCSGVCPLFHPACGEEVAQVILDVWSWRWASLENQQLPMDQAQVFSVFLRVPLSALNEVLALSGWHGIFVEPRPDSKQGAHPSFVVVWLPRHMSLSQALDFKRRNETVVGVARMQQKLGLRAYKKHEQVVQELVYPGKNVVVCSVDSVYEVGPLPHGLSHSQVADLLKAWNWIAKPLKPLRSSSDGQYWDIGTASVAPSAILHTDHGTVTVTLKRDKAATVKPAIQVQASTRTRKHMLSLPSSSGASSVEVDPWISGDPWTKYKPTASTPATGDGQDVVFTEPAMGRASTASSRIAALEERLMNQLTHINQSPPPGLADMEAEPGLAQQQAAEIAELKQQNAQFVTWFNDVGSRFCGMDHKMQAQQAKLDELQQALMTQGAATQKLQNDVCSLQSSFQAELKAGLEAQTARLESLLGKRPRTN